MPTVAVLQVTIIVEVSVDFVPVIVCELVLVGLVTALMVGMVGAVVSRVIDAVTTELMLPAWSLDVTDILLTPSVKVTEEDHVVALFSATARVPFIHMELLASLVPDRVWVLVFVGEVTEFSVGALGAVVSSVIDAVTAELMLPAASIALALMVLAPAVRLVKVELHVVDVG